MLSSLFRYLIVRQDLTVAGEGTRTFDLNGLDVDVGPFFLVLGVALVLVSIVLWIQTSNGGRVFLALVAILASGYMFYLGVANLTDLSDDSLAGLAQQAGGDQAAAVENLRNTTEFTAGFGLYLGTGGAAVALLGGLLALRPRRSSDPASTPLPAGWQPPVIHAPPSPAEPREDPHAPWRPPNIDHSAEAIRTSEQNADPRRRHEPPDRPDG